MRSIFRLAILIGCPGLALAQRPAIPLTRDLGPVVARATVPLAYVSVWGDADGNLWVRLYGAFSVASPDSAVASPQIYDVVNRAGTLVDRVRLPIGARLVGFGPGVVYLTQEAGDVASLVRARIR